MRTRAILLAAILVTVVPQGPARAACGFVLSSPSLGAQEGVLFSGIVTSFTGPGTAGEYTAAIDWGDGLSSSGTIQSAMGGGFDVQGSHTFGDEGPYLATVKVLRMGSTGTVNVTVSVSDGPLTSNGKAIQAAIGVPFNGVVATFGDAAPHTTNSSNTSFVSQVYLDLLHRSPTAGEISTWLGFLSGMTRAQMADSVQASAEGRSVTIQGAYQKYLGRAASGMEVTTWTTFLNTMMGTLDQLEATIIGSTEYFANRAGTNNDCWADALYRDVLGRAIDPTGLMFVQAALMSQSRTQVAQGVLGFAEADQFVVKTCYRLYLHREADAMALSTFTPLLQSGTRDEAVISQILGSAEYSSRLVGYTAAIDWGDGNVTPGTVASNGPGTFDVSGSHMYSSGCAYPVTVTIDDLGGSFSTASGSASLDQTDPVVTPPGAATVTQTLCQ